MKGYSRTQNLLAHLLTFASAKRARTNLKQMRVHTQALHFSADRKLLQFIEARLQKLELFFDRIIAADVVLKLENSGQIKDKIAEIRLKIPGGVLFVKDTQKTFEASIDCAAEALKRQLIKYKERTRSRS